MVRHLVRTLISQSLLTINYVRFSVQCNIEFHIYLLYLLMYLSLVKIALIILSRKNYHFQISGIIRERLIFINYVLNPQQLP